MLAKFRCPFCGARFEVRVPKLAKSYVSRCTACKREFFVEPLFRAKVPVAATREAAGSQIAHAIRLGAREKKTRPLAWSVVVFLCLVFLYPLALVFLVALAQPHQRAVFLAFFLLTVPLIVPLRVGWLAFYYRLLAARETHFRREAMLREGVLHYLRGAEDTSTLAAIHGLCSAEEDAREPLLWTLLAVFLPVIIDFYILFFTMRDLQKHHRRTQVFFRNLGAFFGTMQVQQGSAVALPNIPERRAFIYLALSILIPFFVAYWLFAVAKDMRTHIAAQQDVEKLLLGAI